MTRVDDALLAGMVQAIVDVADPRRVILFGSRARGDALERVEALLEEVRRRLAHAVGA